MEDKTPQNQDTFIRLFTKHQSQIYGYIVSLIANLDDSDDIFQDVASSMWHNFDKFKPGTDFTAWGIRIARNKVIDHVRKQKSKKVFYSEETINLISDYRDKMATQREERIKYLENCLAKLSEKDQDLVKLRYNQHKTTKSLAEKYNRSVDGLYKTLSRIHFVLYRCIKSQMESA